VTTAQVIDEARSLPPGPGKRYVYRMLGDRDTWSGERSAEVTIDADYNLDYENVIKCITAVSGEKDAAGHITKMVEKIKFAPPRPPGG